MILRINENDLECVGADVGGEAVYHYEGAPFNGILEDYEDGVLIGESEYRNGSVHGFDREYYSSGEIKEEYYWYYNGFHGDYKQWDEAGILISHTVWLKGKFVERII